MIPGIAPTIVRRVGSGYPIGMPELLTRAAQYSAVGVPIQLETEEIYSDGSALLVIVGDNNNQAGPDTYTVTIGSEGRSYGTGDGIAILNESAFRYGAFAQVYFIPDPAIGDLTIQAEGTYNRAAAQVAVFRIPGAVSAVAGGKIGGTNANGLTSSAFSSTEDGSYVLWLWVSGSDYGRDYYTIDYGGTDIFFGNTKDLIPSAGSLTVWLFGEPAPTAGSVAAKVSYSSTTSSMVGIVLYSVEP